MNGSDDLSFTLKWKTPDGFTHYYQTKAFTAHPVRGEDKQPVNDGSVDTVAFVDSGGRQCAINKGTVFVMNGAGQTVDRIEPIGDMLAQNRRKAEMAAAARQAAQADDDGLPEAEDVEAEPVDPPKGRRKVRARKPDTRH